MKIVDCDYLVVGSGMAGLMSALHLAVYGKVVVVTKARLQDCNSNFAQGGICSVADPADSFDKHARDTLIAGAWLGNREVVHEICENAPAGIQDLLDERWGVQESLPETAEKPKISPFQLSKQIQTVIDEDIRPMLADDNGDVEIVDIKENLVYVELTGACATCPGASGTVQYVIETKLREKVDDALRVIPV